MGPRTLPQSRDHRPVGRSLTYHLGFVAALKAEAHALGILHSNWSLEISGMGPSAAMGAAHALVSAGCNGIVSWGVAGGLSPGLAIGDLVIPEHVQRGDRVYPADARLRERLAERFTIPVHGGTLITTDEVIRTPEKKSALHLTHGAVAVDMESAAIAEAAAAHGIAFVAVRAISDAAGDALPAGLAGAVDVNTGGLRAMGVARLLVTKPHQVLHLVRAGRHFNHALSSLRTAALAMGELGGT